MVSRDDAVGKRRRFSPLYCTGLRHSQSMAAENSRRSFSPRFHEVLGERGKEYDPVLGREKHKQGALLCRAPLFAAFLRKRNHSRVFRGDRSCACLSCSWTERVDAIPSPALWGAPVSPADQGARNRWAPLRVMKRVDSMGGRTLRYDRIPDFTLASAGVSGVLSIATLRFFAIFLNFI